MAARVSPPPAMLKALLSAIARATVRCPGEGVELEHADRAVPDDGAGGFELVGQDGGRLGADVEDQVVVSHVGGALMVAGASAAKALAVTTSTGWARRRPRLHGLDHSLGVPDEVGLGQRLADLEAGGQHEGVGDATADDQAVHVLGQALQGWSAWSRPWSRRRWPPAGAWGWPGPWRWRRSGGQQRAGAGDGANWAMP